MFFLLRRCLVSRVHTGSCAQIKLFHLLSSCVATKLHEERRYTKVGRCTLKSSHHGVHPVSVINIRSVFVFYFYFFDLFTSETWSGLVNFRVWWFAKVHSLHQIWQFCQQENTLYSNISNYIASSFFLLFATFRL